MKKQTEVINKYKNIYIYMCYLYMYSNETVYSLEFGLRTRWTLQNQWKQKLLHCVWSAHRPNCNSHIYWVKKNNIYDLIFSGNYCMLVVLDVPYIERDRRSKFCHHAIVCSHVTIENYKCSCTMHEWIKELQRLKHKYILLDYILPFMWYKQVQYFSCLLCGMNFYFSVLMM